MYLSCFLACALIAFTAATKVSQCPGQSIAGLDNDIQLVPCKRLPCRLKKGTDEHITVRFTPEKDVPDITNEVTAEVLSVPLPFVGVDGKSICDKLETESGEKASCPLKAGTKYVYKDSFHIESFYPSLETKVHWALKHKQDIITCFEVGARIV